MFPLTTKEGGQALAFPDVCKVPSPAGPVPTPFPNIAMLNTADSGTCTSKVKVMNKPVITLSSEIPRTQGDEAGVGGGVTSGTNMDKAVIKKGVSKVKIEGDDAVNQLKPTAHNGSNANAPGGTILAPGQTKVLLNG